MFFQQSGYEVKVTLPAQTMSASRLCTIFVHVSPQWDNVMSRLGALKMCESCTCTVTESCACTNVSISRANQFLVLGKVDRLRPFQPKCTLPLIGCSADWFYGLPELLQVNAVFDHTFAELPSGTKISIAYKPVWRSSSISFISFSVGNLEMCPDPAQQEEHVNTIAALRMWPLQLLQEKGVPHWNLFFSNLQENS